MKNRIRELDIAKGIGILLVVLGHLPIPFFNFIYSFHMPLFFILSGFFFSPNIKIVKRIKVLLQAYCFYYIVAVIKQLLVLLMKQEPLNIYETFNPEYINGPIWFIISLAVTTIVAYVVTSTVKNKFIIFIFSLTMYFIGILLIRKNIILPLYIVQSLLMQFFFIIGYIIYTLYDNNITNIFNKINSIKLNYRLLIIPTLFIIIYFLQVRSNVFLLIVDNPIYFIVSGILGTIAILFISSIRIKYINDFLDICGQNSLHIMGFHKLLVSPLYFFIYTPILKYFNIQQSTILNSIPITIVSFVIITCLSLLWSKFISKFNCLFK